jgi:hypothetical protein
MATMAATAVERCVVVVIEVLEFWNGREWRQMEAPIVSCVDYVPASDDGREFLM